MSEPVKGFPMAPNGLPGAVLWDLHGTILDSAPYHWLSWQATLPEIGFTATQEWFATTLGRLNSAILRELLGENTGPTEIARIAERKEARYRELVRGRGVELLPGVGRWLARLRAEGWRQALATSAPRRNVEVIVSALRLESYLSAVIQAEDVQRGKPDPQVFLLAAAQLGVEPGRCIVVEDSQSGIEAARRAGMHCIGVGPDHAELRADVSVRSLDALPDGAFQHLLSHP